MDFKSLIQLLDHFKDEETCIAHYEAIRWGGNPACPHCGSLKPYKTKRGWRCSDKECKKDFTVKTGTIFQSSNIKFRIWFAAIYLATTCKKGISSVQLATQLNISQPTAWFLLHRIREMLKDKSPRMLGENNMVEGDETYLGGSEKFKHYGKKRSQKNPELTNEGKPYKAKKVILGLIERNGKVVIKHVPDATTSNMVPFIHTHVVKGAEIHTDEAPVYRKLRKNYTHKSVKHAVGVYVDGNVYTNTIENFWSVLKRGINGIYHQVSDKHVSRYLDEFAARFNTRELTPQERFDGFLEDAESVLGYKALTENY
ncbi:IS1595 family transposase [Flagellimonas aequoris]|uniref:IS1595 family transposase n=1 Tax=Flagellimonas aequoris TaxID=2306997 RepID=A0A418NAM2_9FLAO|nr:IS1595 family transposase [Allomuricauda aequoris]RIV73185.1 IS1595 family transposase [Allomuricauda aequoris]TXK06996.1 IS1595 family transposase [Allomuricauda aequoris]